MAARPGAVLTPSGARFSVHAPDAAAISLCLYDETGTRETARLAMPRTSDGFSLDVAGVKEGARYGYRAEGRYDPDQGLWFDPAKLLVDPYATELDRPFRHDPQLSVFGVDTADLVPRAILRQHADIAPAPPHFCEGGLIYEVAVRPFTMCHPDIPAAMRGTVAALAHPAVIAHLQRLKVSAVELMPIVAWIDERHLPALGLTNGWGYNPVALMALDPRLVPGGMRELADTVSALHAAGIGVILDLVFNHTGESDRHGATLSLRGLDNRTAYRHHPDDPGLLINDTGCGNTLRMEHPVMRQLFLDTLIHFVRYAGVDGFRFDLAATLFRLPNGFDAAGETMQALLSQPELADRVLIAEPWDIGPGGYQLGRFPSRFLEWNDRARDTQRRVWRGDHGQTGALATVLAGASDVFHESGRARGVTFIAAHDGFTLADLVSHAQKHNEANGENNRDGHDDNHSWNNGAEGKSADPAILATRERDLKALLSTLFATRGTIMLTAGDEMGRSQRGNNNAYAQDNPLTWLDWEGADQALVAHTAFLAGIRARFTVFSETAFFTGKGDVIWWHASGQDMQQQHWDDGNEQTLGMILGTTDRASGKAAWLAILFNRGTDTRAFRLPDGRWTALGEADKVLDDALVDLQPRSVVFLLSESP